MTQRTVRLGMSRRKSAEPYFLYREAVTVRAVALLSPKKRCGFETRIRLAVQVLFATATDEAWWYGIPLTTAGKCELAKEYGQLMRSCLGIPEGDSREARSGTAILPDRPVSQGDSGRLSVKKRALRSYEPPSACEARLKSQQPRAEQRQRSGFRNRRRIDTARGRAACSVVGPGKNRNLGSIAFARVSDREKFRQREI